MARATPALVALRKFIRRQSLQNVQVARGVGVSKGLVTGWLSGEGLPGPLFRVLLERWTGGEVRADDWFSLEERAQIARQAPYRAETPASSEAA